MIRALTMKQTQKDIVTAIVGVFVTFGGFLYVLKYLGLFDFSGTDASAKIIAAAIALVGAFFAAMVTLTGLLLRQSIERRNLQLQKEANEQRREEAETNLKRLDMEAAIKAVELFKTTGEAASKTENAGAMFALSMLGQHRFVMQLLSDLWPDGKIESSSAIYLINDALKSPDKEIQYFAASNLEGNSERLLKDKGSFLWPDCLQLKWLPNLDYSAKVLILHGFIQAAVAKPLRRWEPEEINGVAMWLAEVVQAEDDRFLKGDAALALGIILKIMESWEGRLIHPERGLIQISYLEELAQSAERITTKFKRLIPELEAWAGINKAE